MRLLPIGINSAILAMVGILAVVNAYDAGLQSALASCAALQCSEVWGMADLTNPLSPPTTVNFDIFFQGGKSSYNCFSGDPLGGTDTKHNTAQIMHAHNCNPKGVDCAAQSGNGRFSLLQPINFPLTDCTSYENTPKWFCADSKGYGVGSSWNEGKKKSQ